MRTSSATRSFPGLVLLLSLLAQCALSGHIHKYDYKLKIKDFTLSSVLIYNENDGQLIKGSLTDIIIISALGQEVTVPDVFTSNLGKPFGISADYAQLKFEPSDPEWSRNMKRGLVSLFSGLDTTRKEKHALAQNSVHFHSEKEETIYGLCPVTTQIEKLGENIYDTGRSVDVAGCVTNGSLSFSSIKGSPICGLDMSVSQTIIYQHQIREESDGSSMILTKASSSNDVHHLGFDHIQIEQALSLLDEGTTTGPSGSELSPEAESVSIQATYSSHLYGVSTTEPNVEFVDQMLSQLVTEQQKGSDSPILLILEIVNEFFIFQESDFNSLLQRIKASPEKVHLLYHLIAPYKNGSGLKALAAFTASNPQYQSTFAEYLQALPFAAGSLSKNDLVKDLDYLAKDVCGADYVQDNDFLKSSCLLALATILDQECSGSPSTVKPGSCSTDDLERIFKSIKVSPQWSWDLEDYSGFSIQEVILAVKIVKNSGFRYGTEFFGKVIRNKALNIHIRASAAWAGVAAKPEHLRVYSGKFLTRMFDETEDHEMRNAAFVALLASRPSKAELVLVANKLKAQIETGDRQFYLPAIQSFKITAEQPVTPCNAKFIASVKSVYDEILKPVEDTLGPVSLLDSQVKSKKEGNMTTMMAIYAFESGASPRSYYRRTSHRLGNRDVSIRSDNEGLLKELVKTTHDMKATHLMAHVDKPIAISYGRNGKEVAFAYASLSTIIGTLQKKLNHQSLEVKHHYLSIVLTGSGLPANFYSWQDGLSKRNMARDKSGHPMLDVHYNYGTMLMSNSFIPQTGANNYAGKFLRKELNVHLGLDPSGVKINDLRDLKLNLTLELLAEDEQELDLYRESLQTYSHSISNNKPLRYLDIQFDGIPTDEYKTKKLSRLEAYTGLDITINSTLSDAQRGSTREKIRRVLKEWQPYQPLFQGRRAPYSTVVTLRSTDGNKGANLNLCLDYKASVITNQRTTRNATLSLYDSNDQLSALIDLNSEYIDGESLLLINLLAKSVVRGNKVINVQSKIQFSNDLSASHDAKLEANLYGDESGTRKVATVKGTMSRTNDHDHGHHGAHAHHSSANDITADLLSDQKHYRFNKGHFEINYADSASKDDVTLLPKFWDYLIAHYTIQKHDRSQQTPSIKSAELTIEKQKSGSTDLKIKTHMGTFEFVNTDLKIPLGSYKKTPIYGKSIVHQLKPGFVGHICSFTTKFGLKTFDGRTVTKESDPSKLFGNCNTLIAETEPKSFRVKRTASKVTIEYNNEITVEIAKSGSSSTISMNGELVDAQEGKTVTFLDFYLLKITGKYEVSLPNGYIVYVCDQVEDVIVKVNLLDRNITKGICGNNNGDGRDDQLAKDGQTRINNPVDFIKEYTDATC